MQRNIYELIGEKSIPELSAVGMEYRHRKSGARVFTLKNDDVNRVFCIAFRTTPSDSTGVAHILEHSVLCGSKKFPLKDPFVELAKGSLNTFLNAMTYPDKTVYPIASTNEKDFDNLMDVYMDAVLHPDCIRDERIFRQEGWHYELADPAGDFDGTAAALFGDGQEETVPVSIGEPDGNDAMAGEKAQDGAGLSYNGVVYNEMKGAFSSPDEVLERTTLHALFPNTTYGNESGGDPQDIPSLSYEAFCEFHRRYYHPSNAYIILYGDLDMEKKLEWLDREYLHDYDAIDPDSGIERQEAFPKRRREEEPYAVLPGESLRENTYLSLGIVLDGLEGQKERMAFSMLEYALLTSPGAPLKQALLSAGIGQDVYGGLDTGILQPYFAITAKNTDMDKEERFLSIIEETLRGLCDQGLDKKALLSAIRHDEFLYREEDYGRTPKGLVYALSVLESWLYGGKPWSYLECLELYDELRKELDSGYFEGLVRKYLLDNPHSALIVVRPESGLTEKQEQKLETELSKKLESMSPEEREKLAEDGRKLAEWQASPTPEEDLLKLPLLEREDISREAEEYHSLVEKMDGTGVLFTELPTKGISYLQLLFSTADLTEEELQYASFLRAALAYMDTRNHGFQDLASEIYLHLGGLNFSMNCYGNLQDSSRYTGCFIVDLKFLEDETGTAFSLLEEILHSTKYGDQKRMGEILNESLSRMRMRIEGSSHNFAVGRAGSYYSASSAYYELTEGISFFRFLEKAVKLHRENPASFAGKLEALAGKLFDIDRLFVSVGSGKEGFRKIRESWGAFRKLYLENSPRSVKEEADMPTEADSVPQILLSGNRNEGFRTSSMVNYVARSGRFDTLKHPYTGALRVLTGIMDYEYLWQNLRVRGGAYGCMCSFGYSGESHFVSYRDPHIEETDRIYRDIPDYLRSFEASPRDMTKYVIGTISRMDTPLSNHAKTARALSAYIRGISNEMFQKIRDEVLDAEVSDIRALADYVEEILQCGASCTIGNAAAVDNAKELFYSTEDLFPADMSGLAGQGADDGD